VAIDGKHQDITAAAHRFAAQGVDTVLALAGRAVELCVDAVRQGGRVAYPNGVEPAPKKRRGIEVIPYDAVAGPRQFEHLDHAVEKSRLEVPIAAVFRLEEARRAHERLEEGHVLGKLVLRIT
jgi:NADPH2:quinone reductase